MAIRLSTGLRNMLMGDGGNNDGSFQQVLKDGVLELYSGSRPASADDAETGAKLVRITVDGGAFTPGSPTNGLEFDNAVAGKVSKAAAETWQGTALATGVAGWFRFYANDYGAGASSSAVRFDGTVGTSGADCNISSTQITAGATQTVDSFDVTLPVS